MNTRSRNVTQGIATHNCELSYFTSITRKRLASSIDYAILLAIELVHEERRERHDCYGRYIANPRGSSRNAQSSQVYRPEIHQFGPTRSCSSGRPLQSAINSPRSLYREKYQTRGIRQKIKPASCWQGTIKKFVAARFLTNAWKTEVKNHRDVLPISSIQQTFLIRKVCRIGCGHALEKRHTHE
jgi:hypothetical protein